ncbi:MAG TPA: PEPxxWA-CTERM sorting domain-containing protein [Caulobacteraceae bacterium]|jgi:hypothetical protein
MLTTRLTLCAVLAATCVALGARPAVATSLTFDDLPNPGAKGAAIANGYGGLTWDNFTYVNAVAEQYGGTGLAGYNYGDISGSNVALNGGGAFAGISSATPFEFNSGYFTAAWNNGLQITLTGYLNGVQVDQTTFTVSTRSPSLVTLDWSDVTSVTFSSSGGTNAGYRGFGEEFAVDNLAFTPAQVTTGPNDLPGHILEQTVQDPPPSDLTIPAPEPAGWALMIIGVGLVGGMLRRRVVVRGA